MILAHSNRPLYQPKVYLDTATDPISVQGYRIPNTLQNQLRDGAELWGNRSTGTVALFVTFMARCAYCGDFYNKLDTPSCLCSTSCQSWVMLHKLISKIPIFFIRVLCYHPWLEFVRIIAVLVLYLSASYWNNEEKEN